MCVPVREVSSFHRVLYTGVGTRRCVLLERCPFQMMLCTGFNERCLHFRGVSVQVLTEVW